MIFKPMTEMSLFLTQCEHDLVENDKQIKILEDKAAQIMTDMNDIKDSIKWRKISIALNELATVMSCHNITMEADTSADEMVVHVDGENIGWVEDWIVDPGHLQDFMKGHCPGEEEDE